MLATKKIEANEIEVAAIYELYPKKVAKPAALKAIRIALRKTTFDVLMDAVAEYAAAVNGSNRQFIPYPATWFNQERWTDDRSTWRNTSKPADPTRVHGNGSAYDGLV